MNGYTPRIKHGVLENGPFTGDVPPKTSIHREFSIAMFDYQRVIYHKAELPLVNVCITMEINVP